MSVLSPAIFQLRRLLLASAVTLLLAAPAPAHAAERSIEAYRGKGAWIDIYDTWAWNNPGQMVRSLKARGVRTLYIQTGNSGASADIMYPGAQATIIHAAHARGMRVVAWYLPTLVDMPRDRRRSLAAIRFRTPGGQRFDSFALDIESSAVGNVTTRTQRVISLSSYLRANVASWYTLGAIIPAPRGMQLAASYWPGFPYEQLAARYDVFLPMGYFSYRVSGLQATYDYTALNAIILRREVGDNSVPIHMIGGIADGADRYEVRGFVQAVRAHGLLGASLYDVGTSGAEDWAELATTPVNPRQAVAMPVAFGHRGGLGNIPGTDRSHAEEVVFRAGPRSGSWEVRYSGFDIGSAEVDLYVNFRRVGALFPTDAGRWSRLLARTIPAGYLSASRPNTIAFVSRGTFPNHPLWGVRSVWLAPAD